MEKGRWSEDKNVQLLSRPVRQQPLGSLLSSLYLFLNNCNHLASHLGLDLPYFQSLSLPSVLYFLPTSLNTLSNFNPSFSLHRRPFPVSTFVRLPLPHSLLVSWLSADVTAHVNNVSIISRKYAVLYGLLHRAPCYQSRLLRGKSKLPVNGAKKQTRTLANTHNYTPTHLHTHRQTHTKQTGNGDLFERKV